jgi:hypothetical protein
VEGFIMEMGTPEAAPLWAAALRDRPSVKLLVSIADHGEVGRPAGDSVVPLLSSPERDVRLAAGRTLGLIGYTAAVAALSKQLEDEDDWQAVYVAAESLGYLHAAAALPALDGVAGSHWYAPVRDGARLAASVIRKNEPYPADTRFGFFDYLSISSQPRGAPPFSFRTTNELSAAELKGLAYDVDVGGEEGKHRRARLTPAVGVKTAGGFLVGADRGEWGGELMFLGGHAPPVRLLGENTSGIFHLGSRIVVVTGLAHLLHNGGALYLASSVGPGKYEVSYWKTLPGAPRQSGILDDGSLYVSCWGGDIVVEASGRMKMVGANP